jgi:hypothetical protein
MSILTDLWSSVHAIVMSADWVTLAIMVAIALGAGFMMQNYASIVTTTFVALIAFALAGYVRAIVAGQNAESYAQTDWHNFLGLHMLTLVAYALTFAIVISLVHAVRSIVQR